MAGKSVTISIRDPMCARAVEQYLQNLAQNVVLVGIDFELRVANADVCFDDEPSGGEIEIKWPTDSYDDDDTDEYGEYEDSDRHPLATSLISHYQNMVETLAENRQAAEAFLLLQNHKVGRDEQLKSEKSKATTKGGDTYEREDNNI